MADFPGSNFTSPNTSQSAPEGSGELVLSPSITQAILGAPPITRYYKMIGYYTTGAVYEAFVVTGSPSPASVTNPNTGHALVNTFVSSFWAR